MQITLNQLTGKTIFSSQAKNTSSDNTGILQYMDAVTKNTNDAAAEEKKQQKLKDRYINK